MLTFTVYVSRQNGKDGPVKMTAPILPRVGERLAFDSAIFKVTSVTHRFSGLGGYEYTNARAQELTC